MRTTIAFVATTLLAATSSFGAQDDKLPTDQHKKLDTLIGTWDVAIRFKAGPDNFREGKATCTAEWILNGNALQQTYKSSFDGQPFTVLQMLGYDTNKKKFFELKLDSMDTGVMHNEGTLSDDGKTLTFKGERVPPEGGNPTLIRTVYTLTDNDHFTLDWYMPGADGKEEKAVSLVHTRKK